MTGTKEPKVPDELISTYKMVKCAFPDGINRDDYYPLLAILYEKMSFRRVAEIISLLDPEGKYPTPYNDVIGIVSTFKPTDEDIDRVKQILIPCEYQKWADED